MSDTIDIVLAQRFDAIRDELASKLKHFDGSYKHLLEITLKLMFKKKDYHGAVASPNTAIIHVIDDGHYQGTLLFVVPEDCYQPSRYYVTKVSYGSCSGCDTMQAILGHGRYNDKTGQYEYTLNDDQCKRLATLALHLIQGMKVL